MVGQIVNYRYEVLEKLGDGALFSVYRARDKVLNRLVSLKVISSELAANREFAAAVVDGYQATAGLIHTSIARTYDTDASGGECFVATEYVRGVNVKERVKRAGPMSVALALDVIIPVLEAVEYAHANKNVHGDLRPQDIVVSPDGEIKVTDFGLSWALDKCPDIAEKFPMRSIHYQAPEVTEGGTATVASDIYSAGVILYEMLTNTLPFDGATAVSIALKKIRETPTPPRSINAGVPKSLNDIVMQAIDLDPRQRYKSVSEMLAELKAIRETQRTGQPARVAEPHVVVARRATEEALPEAGEESVMRRYFMLVGLFLAVTVLMLALTWAILRPRGEIIVPSLLGKSWDEAVSIARQSKIDLEDDGTAFSNIYKMSEICSVVPPAGSTVLSSNPVVKVKISSGPSRVEVPDLVGMSEPDATDAAVRAGFVIAKMKQEYSDKVPVNVVISQEPPAGVKRNPGSTLDVVISSGTKPEIEQPNVDLPEDSPERRFDVTMEVPVGAKGPEDIMIKVIDDRGETTAYEETHNPGDKFTVTVTTYGSQARIKMYRGGALISDVTK